MTSIINKVRNLINDNYKACLDIFEYTSSAVFTLTESNVGESSIEVYKNGTLIDGSGEWSFDSDYAKLTIAVTLVVGDIIEVHYNAYRKYSDAEINGYINAALVRLSVAQYEDFESEDDVINPTPSSAEENLIALIASILIQGSISSYRTPEITVTFREDESIDDKIYKSIKAFKKSLGNFDYIALQQSEITENG